MRLEDELFCLLMALGICPADDLSLTTIYELRSALQVAWTGLNPKERAILRRRVGLTLRPRSAKEIGVHFGITEEEVRLLETKALERLRHPPRR